MSDPTLGIIPKSTPRTDAEQSDISQPAEVQPGEVSLDAVIRAQSLAPQVRDRILALENSLWRLASNLEFFVEHDTAVLVQARLLLKNRLEIPE